jgi:hypothetical protein
MRLFVLAALSSGLLSCQAPQTPTPPQVPHENFQDLEAEYAGFHTQALTANYLGRKVRHWIAQNNGEGMRREMEFARLKHPALVQNLMTSGPLCNQALTFAEIGAFRSASQDFDAYVSSFSCAPAPVVGTFQLNTYPLDVINQGCPSVAMAAQGNFVVTFEDCIRGGGGVGVEPGFARLYSPEGNPLGIEFPVDEGTTANRVNLQVSSDAVGNFQVVWTAKGPLTQDEDIYLRRYNASGQALGPAVRVNSFITGVQSEPVIATAANGQFVVVWQSVDQDGSAMGVYGQLFDAHGQPVGNEIEVPTTTLGAQMESHVAIDDQGRFGVVWLTSSAPDGYAVYGQRFNAQGEREGSEFQVNAAPIGTNQAYPSVGSDKDGNLQIAWQRVVEGGYQVETRFYPVAGEPSAVAVVATTAAAPAPVLGKARNGRSVIAWKGDTDLLAQRYLANGTADGGPIQVAFTSSWRGGLSLDQNGNFVVVWGIDPAYARRFNAQGEVL